MRSSSKKILATSLMLTCLAAGPSFAAGKDYNDYLDALGRRESQNNYGAINPYGYVGRFQFGEAALKSCQFYGGDATRKNDWVGEWRDEAKVLGIQTKEDFLQSPRAQDFIILRFNVLQWASIVNLDLVQYAGKQITGILITPSGMLGGAHLVGPGNLKRFLTTNGAVIPVDGNGTPITEYIQLFGSFDVPFN